MDLAAVGNLNGGSGGAAGSTDGLELLQKLLARLNLAKDGVLSIQPRGVLEADEELRSIGVGTSVGHGQNRTSVSDLEVLTGSRRYRN